jgi:protein-S-isoprenylcysteine O-methyltransferase Ste14
LGSEHPYGDFVQMLMVALFFAIWSLDSIIFNFSTALARMSPLPLHLLIGGLSIAIGVYLGIQSHKAIFSETHDRLKVIASGVYSWVRHPMYLAVLLFTLGFFFSLSLLSLGIWIAFFFLYDTMATYEEEDLVRLLGHEYTAYQNQVPKWLPRIRRTIG